MKLRNYKDAYSSPDYVYISYLYIQIFDHPFERYALETENLQPNFRERRAIPQNHDPRIMSLLEWPMIIFPLPRNPVFPNLFFFKFI